MDRVAVNGTELAYVRQGKGTPLILIHGYPLDHSIWEKIIPLLADSFDVIAPDLRGFGESNGTEGEYGMETYAEDLAGLLDALDIRQAVIAGHSMGGYVALAFARAHPVRIRGLGLVSSQGLADPPDRKEGRYKSAEEVSQNGLASVAESMATKLSADPRLQDFSKELINKQSASGVVGALKAMAGRVDSMDVLKSFQLPVVLVHGDADVLIPIDRAREIEAAVLQARLFSLPGVGHLPMLEAPEKMVDALKHLS